RLVPRARAAPPGHPRPHHVPDADHPDRSRADRRRGGLVLLRSGGVPLLPVPAARAPDPQPRTVLVVGAVADGSRAADDRARRPGGRDGARTWDRPRARCGRGRDPVRARGFALPVPVARRTVAAVLPERPRPDLARRERLVPAPLAS